jgi:hypothetical protein
MHKYSSIVNGLAELSSRKRGFGTLSRLFGTVKPQVFDKFSDGCKKKYLLDSANHRHLVWGTIAARELETYEDISCRISRRPSALSLFLNHRLSHRK